MLSTIKKSGWSIAVVFSMGLLILQSCATPSSTATIPSTPKEKPKLSVNTIQVVNFNLEGPLRGLVSKVWLSDEASNTYGGVYSWASKRNLDAYRGGELYAGALANNPNFVNLYDKGFDVLEGPSSVTSNLLDGTPTYIQVVNFNLEGITHDDFMGPPCPDSFKKCGSLIKPTTRTAASIHGPQRQPAKPTEVVNCTPAPSPTIRILSIYPTKDLQFWEGRAKSPI